MAMNGHAEAEGAAKQKHVEFKKKLSRAPSVESRDDESISAGAWKKHDATRMALMKAQLERIRDTKGVSKDVLEIATRSIEG